MPNEETIKFDCPHCAQSIEAPAAMRGTKTDCPSCGKKVTVWMAPAAAEAAVAIGVASRQLERSAEKLSAIAGALVAVGGLSIIGSVALSLGSDARPVWAFCIGGLAFYLAPWFFLFGQIMYVRAALEK